MSIGARVVVAVTFQQVDDTPSIDNTSDMHLLVYIDTGFPRLIEIENKGGTVVETIVKEYEDRNSCGVAETQEVFNDVFGNSL